MGFRIRAALAADIPALMVLRAAVTENRLADPQRVQARHYRPFVARGDLWLCEDAGRILGFGAGDRETGWIWALFVQPGFEGRGIGRALLARACDTLRDAGFAECTLSTDPDTRAARVYRRAGWREAGRTADGEVIFKLRET